MSRSKSADFLLPRSRNILNYEMGNLGVNSLTAVATQLGCPFYMEAVIYCRVSTKEQVENFSLESQEDYCKTYAKRNGYNIVGVFIDGGESAKTTDRPEFLRMIEYCRKNKHKIQAVIVYSVSRFSRDTNDHYEIRKTLKLYGTNLLSATEPFEDTPIGHATETMMSMNAQLENELKAERSKVGLKARFDKGLSSGLAPYGYRNIRRLNGQKVVIPDPKVAPLIAFAFTEYSKGIYSKAEITRKLQRKGLKTEIPWAYAHGLHQNASLACPKSSFC